ncbi:unnamed protein product [Clonostachys chloroleuca]|uniref:Saccharopine dehydrogenase NADP binding domain-containing protein n=1 Tax=Clonostachys chloroleuca TaxID=1926264 RepID=A0AA35QBU0_9HYPO|nr:unnamed protein product [Clonostachys chloroleuca]
MARLLIYGATGYTGRLASEHAQRLGLDFLVAGRSESKTSELAIELGVGLRIFGLESPDNIDEALLGSLVLLNCAGPFIRTAKPLIEACIRNQVHYLDMAAELDSYHLSAESDARAKEANIMLMPGCGGGIAMLSCLVYYVLEHVKNPHRVDIALHISGPMSRGSEMSAAENITTACLELVKGDLVALEDPATKTKQFDFDNGNGPVDCVPITLPNLITLARTTNIRDIRTFIYAEAALLPRDVTALPTGPTKEERDLHPYQVSVLVTETDGTVKKGILHCANGYTFTSQASAEASRRVLEGQVAPGFQTPEVLFGYRFVEDVPGSVLKLV